MLICNFKKNKEAYRYFNIIVFFQKEFLKNNLIVKFDENYMEIKSKSKRYSLRFDSGSIFIESPKQRYEYNFKFIEIHNNNIKTLEIHNILSEYTITLLNLKLLIWFFYVEGSFYNKTQFLADQLSLNTNILNRNYTLVHSHGVNIFNIPNESLLIQTVPAYFKNGNIDDTIVNIKNLEIDRKEHIITENFLCDLKKFFIYGNNISDVKKVIKEHRKYYLSMLSNFEIIDNYKTKKKSSVDIFDDMARFIGVVFNLLSDCYNDGFDNWKNKFMQEMYYKTLYQSPLMLDIKNKKKNRNYNKFFFELAPTVENLDIKLCEMIAFNNLTNTTNNNIGLILFSNLVGFSALDALIYSEEPSNFINININNNPHNNEQISYDRLDEKIIRNVFINYKKDNYCFNDLSIYSTIYLKEHDVLICFFNSNKKHKMILKISNFLGDLIDNGNSTLVTIVQDVSLFNIKKNKQYIDKDLKKINEIIETFIIKETKLLIDIFNSDSIDGTFIIDETKHHKVGHYDNNSLNILNYLK